MFCRIIIICRVRSSVWSTGDPCFKANPDKRYSKGCLHKSWVDTLGVCNVACYGWKNMFY